MITVSGKKMDKLFTIFAPHFGSVTNRSILVPAVAVIGCSRCSTQDTMWLLWKLFQDLYPAKTSVCLAGSSSQPRPKTVRHS